MGFDPSGIPGECFVHICIDASLRELSIKLFDWREFKNRPCLTLTLAQVYLAALLNFDIGVLNNFCPFRNFRRDPSREICRRTTNGNKALLLEFGLKLWCF